MPFSRETLGSLRGIQSAFPVRRFARLLLLLIRLFPPPVEHLLRATEFFAPSGRYNNFQLVHCNSKVDCGNFQLVSWPALHHTLLC